jgi:THO complex subunit 4
MHNVNFNSMPEKTADELDKDLESYHAEAMKTD